MTSFNLALDDKTAPRVESVARWTRVLCVLFFFSGFPALIYQLIWQRALFRIFGVNAESVTIVVTAFILGLGIGSLAGGWLSKRRDIPLLPLLAAIELLTGAFGLASLAIFERVGELTIGLPLALTAGVTLALVIVPTLLMGATLPVLVSHLVRCSGNVGSSVALLYYVNTLGAGAACLVCTVVLFPFGGMQDAVYVAAAINGAVAAGALAAHWHEARHHWESAAQHAAAPPRAHAPLVSFAFILGLAAAGGFVSLSYEIFFFRAATILSGSSATSFALTLGAFLIGLASGSRQVASNLADQTHQAAMRRATAVLLGASLLGFLFFPLLDHLEWMHAGIAGVALVMVYLFARFWGQLLPHLAEFGIPADDRAGMGIALLYLANILGSAAGSIITGFVLTDHLNLVGLATMLVVMSLGCAALLTAALPLPRPEKVRYMGLVATLAVLAVFAVPRWSADVLDVLQSKGELGAAPIVDEVENRSGIITVTADRQVFGNGMYDGRFNTDLKQDTNGVVRPYSLSLFHPAPRDVLMIGLSSGSWAQVIANNPDVASLTAVEINPGYVNLIAKEPEVASLLINPKLEIVADDGRRWLRANPGRRFDAIVSNTTWYFRSNASNLLSVEFLELIKQHLNPGGIFFYNTTDSRRVQRTGCVVFAGGARFLNHMVVSDMPIRWDFARWRRTLESYRIDGRPQFDASRSEDRAELDLLESGHIHLNADNRPNPIEPCSDILSRTADLKLVTDDNMGSEWRHSFGLE